MRFSSTPRLAAALAAGFFVSEIASAAQLTYVAQDRSLRVHATANGAPPASDLVDLEASDFAPFDVLETVSASASLGSGSGTGQHRSILGADGFRVEASAQGTARAPFFVTGAGGGFTAFANFEVTFDVGAPSWVTITGTMLAADTITGVELRDAAGVVWSQETNPFNGSGSDVDFGVMLAPGRYTFSTTAGAAASADEFNFYSNSSSVDLTLEARSFVGANYCTSSSTSAGVAATIRAEGTSIVSDNDFTLIAERVIPSGFGLFFYGASRASTPLGDGTLCVGGALRRLSAPIAAGAAGSAAGSVPLAQGPGAADLITPGSTWNFQYWFRDAGGSGGSNTTNALEVTFQ